MLEEINAEFRGEVLSRSLQRELFIQNILCGTRTRKHDQISLLSSRSAILKDGDLTRI